MASVRSLAATFRRNLAFGAVALAVAAAACGGGGDLTTPGGGTPGGGTPGGGTPAPPVTSTLTCAQPNGSFQQCDLVLAAAGGFNIVLTGTSCKATDNTLVLTKPTNVTLTSNGCNEAPGKTWTYAGPYPAGTQISFQITSGKQPGPAALQATGADPSWDINFEDGGDTDFNDLVLKVQATH
jgi:hypothetical protein